MVPRRHESRLGRASLVAASALALASTITLNLLMSSQETLVSLWGVVATLIPLIPLSFLRYHRHVTVPIATLVLLLGIVLSILSIGIYFLPGLVAMVVASFGYIKRTDGV